MDINLAYYGRKEINITDILDAWLRQYLWMSPHDHPYGSVYWDSQGPQQWPPLVLLKYLSTQYHTVSVITHDESAAVFLCKGDSLEEYCCCIINALI